MNIEAGRVYQTRGGDRVKVVDICPRENIYPVCGLEWDERFQSFYWPHKYTREGKWGVELGSNADRDLVALYQGEALLKSVGASQAISVAGGSPGESLTVRGRKARRLSDKPAKPIATA